jgi:hypothetical protein
VNLIVVIGCVVSVVVSCAQAEEKQARPLSVCEVIAHRAEYNGLLVTVRGELRGGPHGGWLAPDSDCAYKLITRGVEWPNVIFMTYPLNQSKDADYHADFKVDWPAIERAEAQVTRARFNADVDRLIETYVGRFVTYPDLENRVSPSVPGARRLGFGPVGLDAPAQLVVKTVGDVVVTHRTPQ